MVNIHSYLQLIRPFNCLMGSLGVFIAALIGAGLTIVDFWRDAVLSLVVVFIFMAGANALNDYYDRLTDKINHPDRPIPSKKISPRNALDFGFIALFIAFILSVFINFTALLIVCIAAILILFYELHFKNRGFVGNVIISLLVGFLFIFGGSVVKSYDLNLMIAFMAFFATLSREIVKDIQDIEGDVDRITLPKKIGIRPAGTAPKPSANIHAPITYPRPRQSIPGLLQPAAVH